jgi:hypothetical protein
MDASIMEFGRVNTAHTQNSARQKTGGDDEILASKGLLLFLAAG